ncbi:S-layer homology domain-containing protein [Caldifermentibacillus hisashii]|uniref:S-layer homology domain-containing protein n=1 Tax=Caldifermentibacillus hisashii TaxID=996558 RepID=UPI0034D76370
MKKYSLVTIFILIFAFYTPKAFAENQTSDIRGHWAEAEMQLLINKGILVGDGNNQYFPDRSITRAEFTKMIVVSLGLTLVSGGATYQDVPSSSWYYPYIMTATVNGLVEGNGNGTFNPEGNITRQEMAKIIANIPAVKALPGNQAPLSFADSESIDKWAYSSVQLLASTNLIKGRTDNNGNLVFDPHAFLPRAEACVVIARLIGLLNPNEQPVEQPGETVINITDYPHDFSAVVDKQAKISPKVDGAGKFLATADLVAYYVNPNNFPNTSPEFYQFLKLSYTPGLNAAEINKNLLPVDEGNPLKGTAEYFIMAGEMYNINPIYLIVHALHETGRGTSALSKGILVSSVDGKPVEPKVTYNMFGVRALDADPNKYGSEYAYKEKWFTPIEAILGGAKFIGNGYINNGQDTLYKMKWNPGNPANHQYATHVQWATAQAKRLFETYQKLPSASKYFDVPRYVNQPASSPLPPGEKQYAVLPGPANGTKGVTVGSVNLRTYPNTATSANIITTLADGTSMDIIGQNGGWYYVTANGQTGWISGAYVKLIDELKVQAMSGSLYIPSNPVNDSNLSSLENNQLFTEELDETGPLDTENGWYNTVNNEQ